MNSTRDSAPDARACLFLIEYHHRYVPKLPRDQDRSLLFSRLSFDLETRRRFPRTRAMACRTTKGEESQHPSSAKGSPKPRVAIKHSREGLKPRSANPYAWTWTGCSRLSHRKASNHGILSSSADFAIACGSASSGHCEPVTLSCLFCRKSSSALVVAGPRVSVEWSVEATRAEEQRPMGARRWTNWQFILLH